MKAYRYVRFSTKKQERGHSLERQMEDIGAFCDRQGWEIVETVQDLGQSAWSGAHLSVGNLGKFAQRVREGEIAMPAVLVVEKLDRLSRQGHEEALDWMRELCRLGLTIAVVEGGSIYDTTALKRDLLPTITIMIKAQLAFEESEKKSERVLSAISKKMDRAQGGAKITAKTPGWLTLNPDRLGFTINEDRADIVRDIYKMAAAGQGARWIAKTLNQRPVTAWGPPHKDGRLRTWEISTVKLILAQPSVEGDYVPGFSNTSKKRTKFTKPVIGYYPRIVDADLVARARAAVEGRRTGARGGGRHTANVANLFAGQVFCGHCQNRMHLKLNGQTRRYLHCNHAARAGDCDQRGLFNYDALEHGVLDEILHLALDNRHFAKPDETGPLSVALAEIDKNIADLTAQARRLVKLAAQVDDDPTVVAEVRAARKGLTELEGRRTEVAAALAAARGAVSPDEHLARVRDLRGALYDEDATIRQGARLRVLAAMKGLGVRLECSVQPGDVRSTLLMLPTGFCCRIGNDGTVTGRLDMPSVVAQGAEGLGPGEEAQVAANRLTDLTELVAAIKTGKISEAWATTDAEPELVAAVETHLRRQRAEQSPGRGS